MPETPEIMERIARIVELLESIDNKMFAIEKRLAQSDAPKFSKTAQGKAEQWLLSTQEKK